MRKRCCQLCAIGLILAGATSEALACSICVTALADSVLPPIGLWVILAMTWFVAGGAIRTFTRIRLPWQPPLLGSVLLALGLWVLGAAMFGLFIVLLLFAPPIRGFVGSLFPSPSPELARGVRATRIVGWLHVCGVVCATGLMVHSHLTRTTEEYISKWGFNGPGQQRFQELRGDEPRSLDAYRYLVQHANDVVACAAAERIGEIGEPARDVPLLRDALVRLGGHGPFTSGLEDGLARLETRQKSTQPDGAADGSQPFGSDTNRTSAAAGSRR